MTVVFLVWSGPLGNVCSRKHDKRGKTKTTKENRRKHPCRLASEKGASEGASELKPHEVPRESKNTKTRRAQNGTPRKHQKKRKTRPKWTMTHMWRGQKNRNKTQKVPVWGVSCDYLICVSQKKRRTNTSSTRNPEEEGTNPKKEDLTRREFIYAVSGATRQNIKAKHRQNTIEKKKTQDQHRRPKTRVRIRKIHSKQQP